MKEYIPNGSVVSERVSEGWMTCLRSTSVAEFFLRFSKLLHLIWYLIMSEYLRVIRE